MRYHPTDPAPPDRALAPSQARQLRTRRPVAADPPDLVEQLATFWHLDDQRAIRSLVRPWPGDAPDGPPCRS